jgi:hypothetical protein
MKEKLQMVDDDQVENVGIMSGFMDEIDELMEELSSEEQEEGDDADMARMMARTPDSPEILMNNLRGDMRSIDARREELADLVGFREAEETPEGVLALLQPILAQQAAPAMPMPAPMPQGMPPQMAGMAPPPMPAGPAPAMAGIGGLPMDQGPAPMAMANGGMVQYFQDGSDEEGVTSNSGAYPPEEIAAAIARYRQIMDQQPETVPDLRAGVDQNLALYQDILGSDPKDTQAQMLFDIGQAALGYAGNVGPDGQPLRGSAAARLAGATRELPGRIGQRAAGMSKEAQALKMAALQAAEAQRSAAQERNVKLAERQADMYKDIITSKPAKLSPYEEKIQDLMNTMNMTRPEAVEMVNTSTFIEPNSGNTIRYNPITKTAEVIDVAFPEPPAPPTTPPEVSPEDLSFDVATGTGAFAAMRNIYSSTLGQLPFLPAALQTEEAAQRLRLLERDAIKALATSNRPALVEQARILAALPSPLDFFQNPEVAQESLANFVDLMGQNYVDDLKYSGDISNPKKERETSEARARATERTIKSLLKQDFSDLYFDTINNAVRVDAGRFGEMSREELSAVNVAELEGDALSAFITAAKKFQ